MEEQAHLQGGDPEGEDEVGALLVGGRGPGCEDALLLPQRCVGVQQQEREEGRELPTHVEHGMHRQRDRPAEDAHDAE
eukprot:533208-Hanusia_phi.AAC.1